MLTAIRMYGNLNHEFWLCSSINKSTLLFWLLLLRFSILLYDTCIKLFLPRSTLFSRRIEDKSYFIYFPPLIPQQPSSRTSVWGNLLLCFLFWKWNVWGGLLCKEQKKFVLTLVKQSLGVSSGNTHIAGNHHRTRDSEHAWGLLWFLCLDEGIGIQSWRLYLIELTQRPIFRHHSQMRFQVL